MKVTDDELRAGLAAGKTGAEIAREFNVSEAAISKRLKRLRLSTSCAVHGVQESRQFVREKFSLAEELQRNLTVIRKLQAACEEWLTDPNDPERFTLEPRGNEVTILVEREVEVRAGQFKTEKERKTLSDWIRDIEAAGEGMVVRAQTKGADPRELVLSSLAEARQTAQVIRQTLQLVASVETAVAFREAVFEVLEEEEAGLARRVAARFRERLALRGLLP